jgi:hypothetical protein
VETEPTGENAALEELDWGSIDDEDGAFGQILASAAKLHGADLEVAEVQIDGKGKASDATGQGYPLGGGPGMGAGAVLNEPAVRLATAASGDGDDSLLHSTDGRKQSAIDGGDPLYPKMAEPPTRQSVLGGLGGGGGPPRLFETPI